jgi:hypothetical protein
MNLQTFMFLAEMVSMLKNSERAQWHICHMEKWVESRRFRVACRLRIPNR